MINLLNNQKALDEVVFENRNKSYGAYALRQSESSNVAKSLVITFSFFLSIFLIAFAYVNKADKIEMTYENIPTDLNSSLEVDLTPQKDIAEDVPKEKPTETPKSETGNVTPTDDKTDGSMSTNENQNTSSTPNPDGDGKGTPTDSVGTGTFTVKKPDPSSENELEKFPDVLPQFDGNMQQFIASNLKYPGIAVSEGAQGVIYVAFVVEKDGSLSNFEVLKGKIGYGCEQEAIRVLKSMPKWKVGYKNNKAIRYPCVLPIKFSLK